MTDTLFGNGKAKTLADLVEGDQIAVCNIRGEFLRMTTVKRKTDKLLLTSQQRFGERFAFTGKQIDGNYVCRIPTPADKKKFNAKKERNRKSDALRKAVAQIEGEAEYRLAKDIGYELCDANHGSPADYLAFARRIGLERLRAFKDAVEEAKA